MKLPSLDPELRPQQKLLVHRQLAGLLVVRPVVGRVVRDVEDLLPEGEVAAQFSRAYDIVTKCGFGGEARLVRSKANQSGLSLP
jgi:hypothetical protein